MINEEDRNFFLEKFNIDITKYSINELTELLDNILKKLDDDVDNERKNIMNLSNELKQYVM